MSFQSNPPRLEHVIWEDTSMNHDNSHLIAHINILGLDMHLEAIEITYDDHVQVVTNPSYEDVLDSMYEATGADSPFKTITLFDNRQYVLFATPFCR